ncbi:MAG: LysE family transporter [Nitrososphaerota archaeon]|nr:LysE family translocator [Candidatus Bathyarchaeota archaeon]MDW8049225.1 LysE family transporter [Nitrososphaerota archaeon]
MLEIIGAGLASFLAALTGAVVPGPVFVLVVSETLRKGGKAAPLIVLGHLLIEGIIILALFLGLGAILETENAKMMISYIGGSMLILLGAYLAKVAKRFKTELTVSGNTRFASKGLVAAGFLSSGSNPHFFLWWVTEGAPLMALSLTLGPLGFVVFLIGHASADLLWFSLIGFSIDKGRNIIGEKTVKAILLSSAVFLLIFGAYLIFTA